MPLVIFKVKSLLERFEKKKCKRENKKNLEYKKKLKEKVMNYMSNRTVMTIHLIVGLIKNV